MLVEPVGEARVQVGADRLGERVVRCVADQQVAKAVAVVARDLGRFGADELAPHERREPGRDLRLLGSERLHAAAVEDLPLDGAALEHPALGLVKLVEPSCEQSLQRRRHIDGSVFGRHREHLGDEERVAARGVRDPLAQVARDDIADQRIRLLRWQEAPTGASPARSAAAPRAPVVPCTRAEAARPPKAAPSTRPGRGTSRRPTGCRRRPRPAAPAPRAACGTPRRSRHRSSRPPTRPAANGSQQRRPDPTAAPPAASPPRPPASR